MKIRTDFITNSSSTSFIIVGISDYKIARKVLEEEKKRNSYQFIYEWGQVDHFDDSSPNYVGLDTKILETMTLPEARKHLVVMLAELGIECTEDQVQLYNEGWYDG